MRRAEELVWGKMHSKKSAPIASNTETARSFVIKVYLQIRSTPLMPSSLMERNVSMRHRLLPGWTGASGLAPKVGHHVVRPPVLSGLLRDRFVVRIPDRKSCLPKVGQPNGIVLLCPVWIGVPLSSCFSCRAPHAIDVFGESTPISTPWSCLGRMVHQKKVDRVVFTAFAIAQAGCAVLEKRASQAAR